MIYVKEIRSNFKCGIGAALGPRTLITGPVGTGKSALLQSIELALTGAVSDLVPGRDLVKLDADLLLHARDGEPALTAIAELSDDTSASWSGSQGRKSRRQVPGAVTPETVFPLRSFKEELFGRSVDNARRFLLERACGAVTHEEIEAHLPAVLLDRYRGIVDLAKPPLDALLAAAARAGELELSSREAAKIAEARTESAPRSAPLKSDLEAAAQRVRKATDALTTAATAEGAVGRIQGILDELHEAKDQLEATPAEDTDLDQDLEAASAARSLLRTQIEEDLEYCLLCGTDTDKSIFPSRLMEIEDLLDRSANLVAYGALLGRIQQLEQELAGQTVRLPTSAVSVAQARTELAAAQEEYTAIAASTSAWEAARHARDSAAEAREDESGWRRLKDALDETVTNLLDASVVAFTERVQSYLPPEDRFVLTLRSGEREVCQWGLERGGRLHVGLSGFESVRVGLALALACSEPVVDGLRLFVPDDRGTDPAALEAVMRALADAPFQVLLLATVEPTEEVPGWTVIRTANGDHQALGVPECVPVEEAKPQKKAKGKKENAASPTLRAIMGD